MTDLTIHPLTDQTFPVEVPPAKGLRLVEFGAAWCSACVAMEPTLRAFAEERRGQVVVHSVDVDANPRTADAYGVRGLPTLLLFADGVMVERVVGAVSKARLEAMIVRHTQR